MADESKSPTGDPLIAETEEAGRVQRAANLFDLRRILAGLFAIYGVILTILGIGASDAEIKKAAGINLNLWVGIGMLIVAALFVLWPFTRPLANELPEDGDQRDQRPESDRFARGARAASGTDGAAVSASQATSGRTGRNGDRVAGGSGNGRQQR